MSARKCCARSISKLKAVKHDFMVGIPCLAVIAAGDRTASARVAGKFAILNILAHDIGHDDGVVWHRD